AAPQNEDGVLPVLVRFNGTPQVTDTGNIVYQFPDLQVSAARLQMNKLPPSLREFHWRFTNLPSGSLTPVILLACANLFGSLWLLAHQYMFPHAIGTLIVGLFLYAIMFLAVPAVRFTALNVLNQGIDKRNSERSDYAIFLKSPPDALVKKLGEAQQLKIQNKQLTADDVVYTTDKDVLEQEFES
ncbi:MAG TPA: hypothetical protein V6C72_03825, partial [Chroococcales cyanobacterium]